MGRSTAPAHLSPARRRLFRRLVADYQLAGEPHALETLKLACEALDRCDQARDLIAEHGVMVADRFGQLKSNPAVVIERDSRTGALRALRELSLDASEVVDSRPPRIGSGALS
jgi:P27 family predicted phage terminase small subunit